MSEPAFGTPPQPTHVVNVYTGSLPEGVDPVMAFALQQAVLATSFPSQTQLRPTSQEVASMAEYFARLLRRG